MIAASKNWFDKQTVAVKKLTIWLSFFAALFTFWGTLKILGLDVLDFTIGCSSYSSQTKENRDSIEAIKTKLHWKFLHQSEFNDSVRNQIRIINGD